MAGVLLHRGAYVAGLSVATSLEGDKRLLARLEKLGGELPFQLKVLIAETATAIHRAAQAKAPTGVTSQLRNMLYAKPTGAFGMEWEVREPMAYGSNVEFGRRPGQRMPPVDALELWGLRVLGEPGLGWPLARSIAKKGVKPQPFFWPAVEGQEAAFKAKAVAILREATR